MSKHFYIPLSAISFPELASEEAITTTAGDVFGVFVGRRNRTKTTGGMPVNPCKDLLILYSKPVSWEYTEGPVMDYPLVVRVSEELVDADSLSPLTLPALQQKGILAWAYSKTIFCRNVENVEYLFRSEKERAQLLQLLSSFQEVKNRNAIKKAVGLWSSLGEVVILPDGIQNEIVQEVKRRGYASSLSRECLLNETRTGACLGFDIAKWSPFAKTTEELMDDIHDSSARDKARIIGVRKRCLQEKESMLQSLLLDKQRIESLIQALQQDLRRKESQLAECRCTKRAMEKDLLTEQCAVAAMATERNDVDWRVDKTVSGDDGLNGGCFRAYYRYVGRKVLEKWEGMDPILQKTVDFIADYPPDKWNWVGNGERIDFVRELWNNVLKPSLCETKNEDAIEKMRNEVADICNHLQSPNSHGLEITNIKSEFLQALCVVLECAGDMGALKMGMDKVKRRDHCLALYGAFKGYAYFPRQLLPECAPPIENVQSSGVSLFLEPDVTRDVAVSKQSLSVEPLREVVMTQRGEPCSQSLSLKQWIVAVVESVIKRSGKKTNDRQKLKGGAENAFEKLKSKDYTVDDYLGWLKKETGWSKSSKPFKELKKELECSEQLLL